MPLRDLLRKKDKVQAEGSTGPSLDQPRSSHAQSTPAPIQPEFTFLRTTTDLQEVIHPPSFGRDDDLKPTLQPHVAADPPPPPAADRKDKPSNRRSIFRRSKNDEPSPSPSPSRDASPPRPRARTPPNRTVLSSLVSSPSSPDSPEQQRRRSPHRDAAAADVTQPRDDKRDRRASGLDRLHLRTHSRAASAASSSVHLPDNLPEAPPTVNAVAADRGSAARQDAEARWEVRATMLAGTRQTALERSGPEADGEEKGEARPRTSSSAADGPADDVDIQTAITLHERGELASSTRMFGRLADPHGDNNPLAQVLYGLALRHGWGTTPDPAAALSYLRLAAANSAAVEAVALDSGLKKGGAAKGELVLAIFELGNSFRYGWGVDRDPVAARQYYETAANLGDTDAMAEVAWCFLQGFGGKKDKAAAARYLRLHEEKAGKTVGNAWIWKDKYDPPR